MNRYLRGHAQRGFTLLEVLLAVSLFAIGFLAYAKTQVSGFKQAYAVEQQARWQSRQTSL